MRSSTAPPGRKEAVFTLRIERPKLDRLRQIADGEYRTLSQQLRHMIDERIALDDGKETAA